jgi:pimeloyl-ACP methyl ester carboxylesterase
MREVPADSIFKTIDFCGVAATYRVTGSGGVPLLLIHAGASSNAQWHEVEHHLQTPLKRIVPDLLGFGGTAPWVGAETLSHDHNADLVATVLVLRSMVQLTW